MNNWITSLLFTTVLSSPFWAQPEQIIDEQILPNGKLIRLTSNVSSDVNTRYAIEFIDRNSNDTIVNFIDSVQHAHCSPPNSIFFIDDSTGFFTESGGCYASYNWLFRTTDRGLTWEFVESGSRTDGNAFNMLNNKTFYMFDVSHGIIIWEMEEGRLVYSLTKNGGVSWNMNSIEILNENDKKEVQSIHFSTDGQVTIVCSENFTLESDRKKTIVLQSNDYGKSFYTLSHRTKN